MHGSGARMGWGRGYDMIIKSSQVIKPPSLHLSTLTGEESKGIRQCTVHNVRTWERLGNTTSSTSQLHKKSVGCTRAQRVHKSSAGAQEISGCTRAQWVHKSSAGAQEPSGCTRDQRGAQEFSGVHKRSVRCTRFWGVHKRSARCTRV